MPAHRDQSPRADDVLFDRGKLRNSRDRSPIQKDIPLGDDHDKESMVWSLNGYLALHARVF